MEWEEHGMGPVHRKCQIVRMLHNGQNAKDAIHWDHECWGRFFQPNLQHVGDNKAGDVSEKSTEVSK
jgi:hypothetical protein